MVTSPTLNGKGEKKEKRNETTPHSSLSLRRRSDTPTGVFKRSGEKARKKHAKAAEGNRIREAKLRQDVPVQQNKAWPGNGIGHAERYHLGTMHPSAFTHGGKQRWCWSSTLFASKRKRKKKRLWFLSFCEWRRQQQQRRRIWRLMQWV